MSRRLWLMFVLLAFLGVQAVCAAPAPPQEADRARLKAELEKLYAQSQPFQDLFHKAIEYVLPSVVSISTTRTIRAPTIEIPFDIPEEIFPFRYRRGMPPREREFKTSGLGSGFIIDAANGYIVTNYHVVEDTKDEDIKVQLYDGREFTAKKVMRDINTEVAVIQIEAKNLAALEWGKSEDLRVGEWVIAVGAPLGFGNTATTGIVSATSTRERYIAAGRRFDFTPIRERSPYAIEDYIQTDAAINPGNSGGPLVTLRGQVVGINTLIVSPTRTSAGLGFAVPQKIAQPVVEQLIATGKVVRGHLGVQIIDPANLTDESAQEMFNAKSADEVFDTYKIKKEDEGTIVAALLPGGPAEKAGVQVGDLIRAVDKTPTPNADALREVIAATRPGTEVTLKVRRKGRDQEIKVTLGEQPTGAVAMGAGETTEVSELGMEVQTLTPDVAEALGYPAGLKGVVVTELADDGPAAKAGIEVRDIVMGVNNQSVGSASEFEQAVRSARGKRIVLLVRRGDVTRLVPVEPR